MAAAGRPAESERAASEPVWDPLVRLTHWGIAAAVLRNGLIVEDGSLVHVWLGYGAFALLALRLLWGVIGTEEARFSAFPPSLSGALGHAADLLAGRRHEHRSHNPLGALMVYTLWATLLTVSVTGVLLESEPFPRAAAEQVSVGVAEARADGGHATDTRVTQLADRDEDEHDEGEDGEEMLEEIHETAANLLLLLAALHVGGVLLESRLSGVNLARAMVTGVRRRRDAG